MQAFASINRPHTGEILDRGLVLRFPGPASFTGETALEPHLHVSPSQGLLSCGALQMLTLSGSPAWSEGQVCEEQVRMWWSCTHTAGLQWCTLCWRPCSTSLACALQSPANIPGAPSRRVWHASLCKIEFK